MDYKYFVDAFDADEKILDTFLFDIKDAPKPKAKTKLSVKKYLKASIANTLFGDVGFYRIMHQDDKMLQKVLELESEN